MAVGCKCIVEKLQEEYKKKKKIDNMMVFSKAKKDNGIKTCGPQTSEHQTWKTTDAPGSAERDKARERERGE